MHSNSGYEPPANWVIEVWDLPHGAFVAWCTATETMAVAGCQLAPGQALEEAAERISQRQVGAVVHE